MRGVTKKLSYLLIIFSLFLVGCSSTPSGQLTQSTKVSKQLNSQLSTWKGTPYRYGGTTRKGVDCSGFVQTTFNHHFKIPLPRTTAQQAKMGDKVSKSDLRAGDLVFFKTGRGENGLHVGIYDKNGTFIHASTSKGVIRSSLDTDYWRKHYWQARRL